MNDLISRQAALKFCHPDDWDTPDERWRPESEYGRFLQALPSVEKRGKWTATERNFGTRFTIFGYECSECERISTGKSLYCPNCGAKMEI